MTQNPSVPGPAPIPIRIVSVPKQGVLLVLWLSAIDGMDTHWSGGETWHCLGQGNCDRQLHSTRVIWKGYAAVDWWDVEAGIWTPAVLEVTERLGLALKGLRLPGQVWGLHRLPGTKKRPGAVEAHYLEDRGPPPGVIHDIKPTLLRRYRVTQLRLGVPNPVMPPTVVTPTIRPMPEVLQPGTTIHSQPATPEQRATIRELARKMSGGRIDKSNGVDARKKAPPPPPS